MFGQQQPQTGGLFSKPAGSLFSSASTAPAQSFAAPTTTSSLFGGQTQTGNVFGAAKPAGTSLFGAATSQPQGSIFGQQQQPATAFGSTTGGTGLFGQKPASAFGQVSQPSIFGQQNTGGGLFGSAPTTGAFGTATTTASTGLFGSTTAQAPTSFTFGQQPQQQPSQSFGFSASQAAVKFAPPTVEDYMQLKGQQQKVSAKQMCITSMKEYENSSIEELRVQDYIAGRTKNTSGTSVGASMFGQQSVLGQQQAQGGGLFSKPAGGLFSTAATSAPAFAAPTTTSSLFGGQTQTGNVFGAAKAGTSLFGAATSQPQGSIFGQQQQPATAFGSTTGGTGLFGQKPASAFGQVSQPSIFGQQNTGGGLFGSAPTSGGFGTATTTATTGLFGAQPQGTSSFTFGQQPQQQQQIGGSIFGPKPSQPFGFGTAQAAPSTFGAPATQNSIFGAPVSKVGTGSIFGAQPQQQQSNVGLFGQTAGNTLLQKPAQPSLFGGTTQNMGGGGMFGTAQQPGFGSTLGGSPPIMLGSNVDISGIQHAIIDAQLSTLPYGDSPLLRSPISPNTSSQYDISSLQKQLRLTNRQRTQGEPSMFSSPTTAVTTTLSTTMTTQLDSTKNSAAELSGSFLDNSFSYKPLVLLPSVGFGAALGLHQSPKLKNRSDSLLKTMPEEEKNVKSLDMSVIYESINQQPQNGFEQTRPSNEHSLIPQRLEFTQTPERPLNETSIMENPARSISPAVDDSHQVSPPSQPQQEAQPPTKKYRVKLTRPEYYCEPSSEELEDQFQSNGICRIEAGLTVGRLGYGSVFWKGPIELDGPVDLDEIVHFRNKEVVVYPDESKKPDVGFGLNKPAEVSLDRVWPVDPRTKQPVKDSDKLRDLGFREKLEKLCQRMDAVFRDYQPATGTWQFEVQHFSKYGFLEEEDDAEESMDSSADDGLKKQAQMQTLVQKAKVPLREIQKSLEGTTSKQQSQEKQQTQETAKQNAKRTLVELLDMDTEDYSNDDIEFSAYDDSKLFQDELLHKKFKFDDTLFESNKLLKAVSDRDVSFVQRRPQLVERLPTNALKSISVSALRGSICRLGLTSFNRSCRVGFSKELFLTSLTPNGPRNIVDIQHVNVVPTVKNYFMAYQQSKKDKSANIFESSADLINFDPPSTFLRLLDDYIIQSYDVGAEDKIEAAIPALCDILCMDNRTTDARVLQCHRMGKWLCAQLEDRKPDVEFGTPSIFATIFHHLICGAPQKAIEAARQAHHYNLALLISLYKRPTPPLVRNQVAKQLHAVNRRSMDEHYAKVLELLSGNWTSAQNSCLAGLSWLQILGVLIWYHSIPGTTLADCVDQLEHLLDS